MGRPKTHRYSLLSAYWIAPSDPAIPLQSSTFPDTDWWHTRLTALPAPVATRRDLVHVPNPVVPKPIRWNGFATVRRSMVRAELLPGSFRQSHRVPDSLAATVAS